MTIWLDRPGVTTLERNLRAFLVGQAASLVPTLDANARQTEEDRRVAHENIVALEMAGLLRLAQSARFGGYEASFRTQLEVTRELARGCGSTAWVACHLNICAWLTRAQVRMDGRQAVVSAREAIRVLVSAYGASGLTEDSPMARIWRDSEVASRHASISPDIGAQAYGQALLGAEASAAIV